MDKVKLNIKPVKPVKFDYEEQEVIVDPVLSPSAMIELINAYVTAYFAPTESNLKASADQQYDFLGAEFVLALAIMERNTNIDVSIEGNPIGDLMNRGIWDKVKASILKYDDFRMYLDRIVADMEKQKVREASGWGVLERVANSVSQSLKKMSDTDISSEEMQKIKEDWSGVLKSMEESPIAGLFKEAEVAQADPAPVKKTRKRAKKVE